MLAEKTETHAGTLREVLRADTHDIHQQLHDHSHFVALFDGSIDHARYCALMRAFYGFYTPLEQAIEHVAARMPPPADGFQYVPRAGLLVQDLCWLGHHTEEITQMPRCPRIGDVLTSASLAGVLYVIEGSTLGAAQIDRAAQRILDRETPDGRRFWAWSRAHNKQRWAAINRHLDHLDRSAACRAAIIKGANDTFHALAQWLSPLDQTRTSGKDMIL